MSGNDILHFIENAQIMNDNFNRALDYIEKLEKVVEAARVASKVINNHYLKEPPHDDDLWFARDELDSAIKELDGEK